MSWALILRILPILQKKLNFVWLECKRRFQCILSHLQSLKGMLRVHLRSHTIRAEYKCSKPTVANSDEFSMLRKLLDNMIIYCDSLSVISKKIITQENIALFIRRAEPFSVFSKLFVLETTFTCSGNFLQCILNKLALKCMWIKRVFSCEVESGMVS